MRDQHNRDRNTSTGIAHFVLERGPYSRIITAPGSQLYTLKLQALLAGLRRYRPHSLHTRVSTYKPNKSQLPCILITLFFLHRTVPSSASSASSASHKHSWLVRRGIIMIGRATGRLTFRSIRRPDRACPPRPRSAPADRRKPPQLR